MASCAGTKRTFGFDLWDGSIDSPWAPPGLSLWVLFEVGYRSDGSS